MSRAALWRQEGNAKERERRAEELFQHVVEEGRQKARAKSILPLWGPDSTFHFNQLLLRNTIHSPYFQKCCEKLMDWNAAIDEIYYEVKSLQPFSNDKSPSTAFCLLLRLMTLRMTDHQLGLTLKHADSPFIRGIGFLYLRYVGMPDNVLTWIEPYLDDEEEIAVETGHRAPTTIGEFVRGLFRSRDFYGTPLPRYPLEIERSIQVRLLHAEKVAERAANHFKNQQRMNHFRTLGSEIMALYSDDENPLSWYKAVVDRVITRDEDSGYNLKYPKFVVTFTEYGNTETVALGEIDALQGEWSRDDPNASSSGRSDYNRGGGGRDRGRRSSNSQSWRGNNDRDLYDEVRRRERETATADKGWARRPPSTKNALSLHTEYRGRSVQDKIPPAYNNKPPRSRHGDDNRDQRGKPTDGSTGELQQPKKRSAEEMAVIKEKKRKLMAKYG
mmetsp:Transcript_29446/g.80903  ORF Transcript_29446/g.80903 Transcript_29446/m.80903 type:complete len:444 (-) Transcript_29446:153-1484(-)